MQRLKRSVVLLCTVLIVSSSASAVSGPAGFADMAGHWAQATVEAATQAGLVNGYPDGNYRPDEPVTRAQFVKLMVQVRGLAPQPGDGGLSGVEGHWLAEQGYIQPAVDAGLVEPTDYGQLDLQPDVYLTRQEAAVFAVRAMNRLGAALTLHGASLPYEDEVADWTTGYLAAASSTGVMNGYPNMTFGPQKLVTRAEAAAIALRVQAAYKAEEVPVWEANSWQVTTLQHAASQVAASPDGTLYWVEPGGQVWRQPRESQPELLGTIENYVPGPLAAAPQGLYFAQGARILFLSTDGRTSQVAGGDQPGFRDGPVGQALFLGINGLCSDVRGNLYVTEGHDPGRVRRVAPWGQVSTLAGLTPRQEAAVEFGGVMYGQAASLNSGTEGPGYLVRLNHPTSCAVGSGGHLFVVVEGGNIQKITPDGQVTWVAGGPWGSDGSVVEAGFGTIRSLEADPWGNLWLLDSFERVRRLTPDGHAYTVAGGGGSAVRLRWRDMYYPSFAPDQRQVDGLGPDARFEAPNSLALTGGEIYVTDQNKLRKVTGHTGWYPADKAVVLQPATDDLQFLAFSEGTFRPGPARLSVALYAPAEAVGLRADGHMVTEVHHPLYTLRWDALPGQHRITPMVRWPDGRWEQASSRAALASEEGGATDRATLISPRPRSWLSGIVELKAISYWQEAVLEVDGREVARGSGLLSAAWDTTKVSDGFHRVILRMGEAEPGFAEVYVGNGGFPQYEHESNGFVAYFFGQRYTYSGKVLPQTIDNTDVLPFHETARALGYKSSWDPSSRLLTVSRGAQTATLNVDTGETTGLKWPQKAAKVVQQGDEFLVDWLFFTTLTEAQGMADITNQIVVFRR